MPIAAPRHYETPASSMSSVVSVVCFFFSSRRRHTRFDCDWSSDVCSSDLFGALLPPADLSLLLGQLLVARIDDPPRGPALLRRPSQLAPLPRRAPRRQVGDRKSVV